MSAFGLFSLLIAAAALLSFANQRLARLPATIGITVLSLGVSLLMIATGKLVGGHAWAAATVASINFQAVVLHGLLAFLLFAGAMHIDLLDLHKQRLPILALSVLSTVLSTVLIGLLSWGVFRAIGFALPLYSCLLFGALISPTDPVSVLAIMRRVGMPKNIETQLAGESLFNDGVGAVLFITMLEATSGGQLPHFGHLLRLLVLEAGGGILIGLAGGFLCKQLLRRVDDYQTEILLTLALAMGGYALADALHLSAPLEAVAAGLSLGGGYGAKAISENARDYVDKFWDLIDGIMNALLFMLLGLEMLEMRMDASVLLAGVLAIPVVLLARWVSVAGVIVPLRFRTQHIRGAVLLLTWGGLRGGLSLALALSLPQDQYRSLLLPVTYIVVVFAIVVQGLTVQKLMERVVR